MTGFAEYAFKREGSKGKLMSYNPIPIMSLEEILRFWSRISKSADCWEFDNPRPTGYGYIWIQDRNYAAHRISYVLANGFLSTGLTVDHECENKRCVKPSHLKAVTSKENSMRGNSIAAQNMARDTCINGHAFDRRDGHRKSRACLQCRNDRQRRCRERKAKGLIK